MLGSTWKADIDLWVSFINAGRKWKFIIAPHQVDEDNISYIEGRIKRKTGRFSQGGDDLSNLEVLIIDNVGMLSSIYAYATITYVGGAFGEGLHNILEPATYGVPVLFGKGRDNHKYKESVDLVTCGGALVVSNEKDLSDIMDQFEKSMDLIKMTGDAARNYILDNHGATGMIMDYIEGTIGK